MCEFQGQLSSSYVVNDFLAVFTLAQAKINQIAYLFDEIIQEVSDQLVDF
jgi:hypothetical protein